jgi:hypothetical protein
MCLQCQPADVEDLAVPVTEPTVPLAGVVLEEPDAGGARVGLGLPGPVPDPGPLPDPGPVPGPLPPIPIPDPPIPDPPIPEIPRPRPPGELDPGEWRFPPIVPCHLDLRDGCWMITVNLGGGNLVGTLRVDRGTGHLIVSGDLYNDPQPVINPGIGRLVPDATGTTPADDLPRPGGITSTAGAIAAAGDLPFPFFTGIPIHPRANYQSYLKVTNAKVPVLARTESGCRVTMTVQQFLYTQPAAGSFQGSFPASPSRTFVFDMTPLVSRFPLFRFPPGPAFSGQVLENGAQVGTVTIRWVSRFFRRARLEIDVLTGAVAPAPVPAPGGGANEWFDTVFAKIGWDVTVVSDQTNVAVPAGVTSTACWSSANLHALMLNQRNPAVNLDAEWHMHLMFVPATMNCGRGVMYDTIVVPREGVASFSDDGYPTTDSANFGAVANSTQRNVPRAFLRSACHEVTHGFNQIHQEQETAADNSIMTTTPSVADVLGGPTTGAAGVFPDQINLGHNLTVRNHLVHMPDPVIRPGGWPFASWFGGAVPQAVDRAEFDETELTLDVTVEHDRIVLGEPVLVSWALTNASPLPLRVPNDVSAEGLFATVSVTDPRGSTTTHRPVAIVCDHVALRPLDAGESLAATMRVFWSTAGFAFQRPGQHTVTVVVQWAAGGRSLGVEGSCPVWVDFPANDSDNAAASLLMDPEVGLWVALGGGADHLTEATARIDLVAGNASGRRDTRSTARATSELAAADTTPRALRGFAPLLDAMENGGGRGDAARRPRKRTR